jgi:protein SCO1/2
MKRGALFLVLLLGCLSRPYHGLEVKEGKRLPLLFPEYEGKVLVLYFGYTHCPDICPRMLQNLKSALAKLDNSAKNGIQVLMISLDPERDTPEILEGYVKKFDPRFEGKLLPEKDLKRIAGSLGIASLTGEEGYIEHIGYAIALDRKGYPRLLFPPEITPEEIATDLTRLARGWWF